MDGPGQALSEPGPASLTSAAGAACLISCSVSAGLGGPRSQWEAGGVCLELSRSESTNLRSRGTRKGEIEARKKNG